MAKLLEDTRVLKDLVIYECLCPCSECTGSYSSSGLGLRFCCRCGCHRKQLPARRDLGITDKAVLTNIKVGEPYTGLSKYTAHTNRRYSKDGTMGEKER